MYVKPAEGLKVPDLDLRDYLPPEGREVVPSEYWTRRLRDGDVAEAPGPPGDPLTADLPTAVPEPQPAPEIASHSPHQTEE